MADPDWSLPPELEAALVKVCRSQPDARDQQLAELRAAHPEHGAALDGRIAELESEARHSGTLSMSETHPTEMTGQIGPYRVLDELGKGGMGVVYLAEQRRPVRRRVAVKVIKLGMDTKEVLNRFRAEQQALAMMDHANIARVVDAGATESGRPYFAMEYVKGIPITDYCDGNRLGVEERLELFRQVCSGVQHAHTKGVIHRDLKPSNVLVTDQDGSARVKIIDFGLARATDHRLVEATIFTQQGQFIGTPEYMSPEQAGLGGLDVDTRTDIYSLGVLLYQLLVGSLPLREHELRSAGLFEIQRMIREEEPQKPSTRLSTVGKHSTQVASYRHLSPEALLRELRGDLDAIVMKAIEKDRTRRYSTPEALADDIQRHLDGEVVLARPPSAVYRARKFVARNRGKVAAGTVIAMCLVAGSVVSTLLYFDADAASQRAQKSATETRLALGETARQRDAAERATKEAEAQRDRVRESNARLSKNLYQTRMILAQAAWRENSLEKFGSLLRQCTPGDSEPDLRRFEWRYWNARSQTELRTFKVPGVGSGVAFGPDGKRVLVRSGSGVLVLDAESGRRILQLRGHTLPIYGAVFSADGALIATVANTWTNNKKPSELKLWSGRTGQLLRSHAFRGGHYASVAFDPNGKRLAVAARGWTDITKTQLQIWDVEQWKPVAEFAGPKNRVPCVAFSPDGRLLAAGGYEVVVWDARTWRRRWTSDHVDGDYKSVAFSADSKLLAACGGKWANGETDVWRTRDGRYLRKLAGHGRLVEHVTFSPTGDRMATASMDGSVIVWRCSSGKELLRLRGHRNANAVAFSPDGALLASVGHGELKIWSSALSQRSFVFRRHRRSVRAALSPDGTFAVSAGGFSFSSPLRVLVWDPLSGAVRLSLSDMKSVQAVAASNQLVATAGYTSSTVGRVDVHDARTGALVLRRKTKGQASAIAFDLDGRLLAWGDSNGDVTVWNVEQGVLAAEFQTKKRVGALVFDRTRSALIIGVGSYRRGSAAGRVMVWGLGKSKIANSFETTTNGVAAMALSSDGCRLAIVGHGGGLVVRNLESGETAATLRFGASAVAFSPNGDRLAAGGGTNILPGKIRLWDTSTWQDVLTLEGHTLGVEALSFGPAGRRLLSAGWDRTVRIWDDVPGQVRWTRMRQIEAAKGKAKVLVDVALDADASWQDAVQRVRSVVGVDPVTRAAALDELANATLAERAIARYHVEAARKRLFMKRDVRKALAADKKLAPRVRKEALRLVEELSDPSSASLAGRAWSLLSGKPSATQLVSAQRAVELAAKAEPDNASIVTTLGVAHYRAGRFRDALATLGRAAKLKVPTPDIQVRRLAFVAMAHRRLGQTNEATVALEELRKLAKSAAVNTVEAKRLLNEAEALAGGR